MRGPSRETVRAIRPRCRVVAADGVIEGPPGAPAVTVQVGIEKVLELLDRTKAIQRCLAAREIAPSALEAVVSSRSLARNLRRVGKHLHPSLVERARLENPPLRSLVYVAWGKGLDEQERRWSAVVVEDPANDVVYVRHPPTALALAA